MGGLFYLASAMAMPLHLVYQRLRGRAGAAPPRWRAALAQGAIAIGIVAGMWLAGALLGTLLTAAGAAPEAVGGTGRPNVIRTGSLVFAVATLALVLLVVEVLRLLLRRSPPRIRPDAVPDGSAPPRGATVRQRRARQRRRVTMVTVAALCYSGAAGAQVDGLVVHRPALDSAHSAGDAAATEAYYAALLRANPRNARATYRLAALVSKRDPRQARVLFQRYVELVAEDPWGYLAVAGTLERMGEHGTALRWYDEALRIAPDEREVVLGRARALGRDRRISAAVREYERWLARHPNDAEARAALARLRRHAGAAAAPHVGASTDGDGNRTYRFGVAVESPLLRETRFGVAAGQQLVTAASGSVGLQQVALRARRQWGTALAVEGSFGALRTGAVEGEMQQPGRGPGTAPGAGPVGGAPEGASERVTPVAQLRARWRAPEGGPSLDARAEHRLLDATPQLVAAGITRSEVRAVAEWPLIRPLRLRGIGRAGVLREPVQNNYRTSVGGGVAFVAAPAREISFSAQQVRYERPSAAGYFAPQRVVIMELAAYLEFEAPSGSFVAMDMGAGLQRVQEFGGGLGRWDRALRLSALGSLWLAAGSDLRLELDLEDAALASGTATGPGWRFVAAALSVRWTL